MWNIFTKFATYLLLTFKMDKDINRIKVVLAEKKRTNKWLAEQLGKDSAARPLSLASEACREEKKKLPKK